MTRLTVSTAGMVDSLIAMNGPPVRFSSFKSSKIKRPLSGSLTTEFQNIPCLFGKIPLKFQMLIKQGTFKKHPGTDKRFVMLTARPCVITYENKI